MNDPKESPRVWAAIATPFDDNDQFDPDTLRENMRRLHAAGVHGIYTTDSDGEFYAIELDEYRRIVDVFADEAQRLGVPTQVGVTWTNTQGIVDWLRYAAERGILGAHVGHPYFMPMTATSYRVFWEDVRDAVPDWFALIQDAPALSHFTSEHAFTPSTQFGARGIYSWFVNFNAPYLVARYDEMRTGQWEKAIIRQQRIMHAFMRASEVLSEGGNLHGILGKAIASCSPFLLTNHRTRRPYLPVGDEAIRQVRHIIEEEFADM